MSRWKLLLVGKNNEVESLLDKLAWRVNLPTLRFLPDGHQSNNYHFDDPPTVQLNLHHPCPARPFVLRAEHRNRQLRGVRISHNSSLVEILARLFHLYVADERRDDRFIYSFVARFLDNFGAKFGEDHRRRDDRVPVAENQRMDARLAERVTNRVRISRRRLAAGAVHRIPRRAEGWDEFAKRSVHVRRHLHQREAIIDAGGGK